MEIGFNKEKIPDNPSGGQIESGGFSIERVNPYKENNIEPGFNKNTQPVISTGTRVQNQQIAVSPMRLREDKIDTALADGLDKFFNNMSPQKQIEFRKSGEATAKEINKLLEETKVNVKKIVSLIKKWLMQLPGVNMFFIEQEAKIKTDEIMKLK